MSTLSAALSARISATDVPCIVQMQQMLRGKSDVLSLAQGIVHWQPPTAALDAARDAVGQPSTNAYCADDGILELREARHDLGENVQAPVRLPALLAGGDLQRSETGSKELLYACDS